MNKLLYNKTTGLLQPWPAGDAEHVEKLESIYEEVEVIQGEQPEFDPATHHLEPTETINLETRTVQRGWKVVENPPPLPPVPTLSSFSLACGRVLWSRIEAAVEAIPDEDAKWEAKQYLLKSPQVERNHPLVTSLAAALELSSEEVDTVFAAAKLIDETP